MISHDHLNFSVVPDDLFEKSHSDEQSRHGNLVFVLLCLDSLPLNYAQT